MNLSIRSLATAFNYPLFKPTFVLQTILPPALQAFHRINRCYIATTTSPAQDLRDRMKAAIGTSNMPQLRDLISQGANYTELDEVDKLVMIDKLTRERTAPLLQELLKAEEASSAEDCIRQLDQLKRLYDTLHQTKIELYRQVLNSIRRIHNRICDEISRSGISPNGRKINVLLDLPAPQLTESQKELFELRLSTCLILFNYADEYLEHHLAVEYPTGKDLIIETEKLKIRFGEIETYLEIYTIDPELSFNCFSWQTIYNPREPTKSLSLTS